MLLPIIKKRLEDTKTWYEVVPGSEWVKVKCMNPDHNDGNPSAGINIESGIHHCFSCSHSFKYIKIEEDDDADVETVIWEAKYDALKSTGIIHIEHANKEFFLPPTGHTLEEPWRGLSTDLLEDCGAYYCDRGLFQGRYVFPCWEDEVLKGYDARIVDSTAKATKAKWYRARDMDVKSLVYPKDVLVKRFDELDHVVVAEGVADALSYIEMEIPAIASFGLAPPNESRVNQLIAMGVTKITLAFDNDEAGIKGMLKVLPYYAEWFEVVPHPMVAMINMSTYKDANEFLVGIRENGLDKREETWDDDEF